MFKEKKFKLYRREKENLFLKNIFYNNKNFLKLFKKKYNKSKYSFTPTHYSEQLKQKRKLKIIYGISNKKYNNYFKNFKIFNNDSFNNILNNLELRVDNFIYRCGFVTTRSQSKQIINHKFIKINGIINSSPSKKLNIGDIVSFNEKKKFLNLDYFYKYFDNFCIPKWIFVNKNNFSSYLKRFPTIKELNLYINFKKSEVIGSSSI